MYDVKDEGPRGLEDEEEEEEEEDLVSEQEDDIWKTRNSIFRMDQSDLFYDSVPNVALEFANLLKSVLHYVQILLPSLRAQTVRKRCYLFVGIPICFDMSDDYLSNFTGRHGYD